MKKFKQTVYHTAEIRESEQRAIQDLGLSLDALMLRAGKAAWKVLHREFPKAHRIAVFCGAGNNAGDGYVLARLAHEQGLSVTIYAFQSVEVLPEPARHAAVQALAAGVLCLLDDDHIDPETDLIVDALLGIGLKGEVREPILSVINQINASEVPVLAIDLPSGLMSDTGRSRGSVVMADVTVTFIGKKIGQMMGQGPDACGHIIVDTLQLDAMLETVSPVTSLLTPERCAGWIGPRPRYCHKNDFGHVLVVGGNLGMPGSVLITAEAALRVGAGLVSIATHPQYAAQALSALPEAMIYGIHHIETLQDLLKKASVCVIGPGLGDDVWARELFQQIIGSHLPMVVDASALRLLSEHPQIDDNWVLTPHPGEAASLLHYAVAEVEADRYTAVCQLQREYGGVVVLKGLGTLICNENQQTSLCAAGNPGMASPGMGDALSGVIAGLIAQGLTLEQSAQLGVYVHGVAADLAAEESGERGLLATDLFPFIRQLINNVG